MCSTSVEMTRMSQLLCTAIEKVPMQLTSWRALWPGGAIAAVSPCLPWYSIPSRKSRQRAGRHAVCLHSKVKEDKCSAKNDKVHKVIVVHSCAVKVLNNLKWLLANSAVCCSQKCSVRSSSVLLYTTGTLPVRNVITRLICDWCVVCSLGNHACIVGTSLSEAHPSVQYICKLAGMPQILHLHMVYITMR